MKLIGIAATNDAFEVEYFRKTYEVPFPLFKDEDGVVHEQLGMPATPLFIGVKISDDGTNKVFHAQLGGFERADEFLDLILKESGLK